MFKRPGHKLKWYAELFFIIIAIVSIIFAFTVSAYKDYQYGVRYPELAKTKFHPIPLCAILIGGIGGGYLFCLTLSGLGELIENSEKIAAKLEDNPSKELLK